VGGQEGEFLHQVLEASALLQVAPAQHAFVGRLVAEEVVVIDLVGADEELQRPALQGDPGTVALVVVVVQEGLGPQGEVIGQRRVVAEAGGLQEAFGGRLQEIPIGTVVGDGLQSAVPATDEGIGAGEGRPVLGMFGQIGLELLPGEVLGVKASPGGTGLLADEGAVLVQTVPGAGHQFKEAQAFPVPGVTGRGQPLPQVGVAGPDLAEVDFVNLPAGGDEVANQGPFPLIQVAPVGGQLHRDEAGQTFGHFHHLLRDSSLFSRSTCSRRTGASFQYSSVTTWGLA